MGSEYECWQLAQNCARWAAENRHPNVRDAFLSMAKGWARLAAQERGATVRVVTLPSDERSAPAPPDLARFSKPLRLAAHSITSSTRPEQM